MHQYLENGTRYVQSCLGILILLKIILLIVLLQPVLQPVTTESVKLFLADDDRHQMNVLKIISVSVQQQRNIHHESTKH